MFLHVCCAPCLATARETLRQTGAAAPDAIFFYNPNIHPLLEFRRRIKALRLYLERDPLKAEIDDSYGLPEYLAAVLDADGGVPERIPNREERCRRCYALRLGRAAERAKAGGFAEFTTTLLASREQDRGAVAEEGEKAAAKQGIRFVQKDLREFLPPGKALRGIYRQQYCGCVFSEEERYRNTKKHLYRHGHADDDPDNDED